MYAPESIVLERDCDAFLIPSGTKVSLPKDTQVTITQALGSSFTINVYGNLVRVDGKDADALGKEPPAIDAIAGPSDGTVDLDMVWDQLKTCYDPEIPVNIVDLGLIYDCEVLKGEHDENKVHVKMTLTAPGCGMGPIIAQDAEQKVRSVPNVDDVHIELVFDPPWDQSRMSEAAKLQLGML